MMHSRLRVVKQLSVRPLVIDPNTDLSFLAPHRASSYSPNTVAKAANKSEYFSSERHVAAD
jgi:hypothetical protein